ncbi:hypothetical protein ACKWTF_002170 [Chironomus riparius]
MITQKCILPLKPDWTFYSPLIFTLNGTLISTENTGDDVEDITLSAGTEVLLSCTPNYFRDNPAEKSIRAICKEDLTLLVNGEEKDFVSELSCDARAIEEIITPIHGCPKNLRNIEYGYTNPIKQKSYVLGEACISTKGGRTLFAHTRVKSPNNDVAELALKVMNGGYLRSEHPTPFYRNEIVKALRPDEYGEYFVQILGTNSIPKIGMRKFINEDLLTHKQYQSILKLAWNYAIINDADELENLQKLQKDISTLQMKTVDVYSGTHGVLLVKNNNDEQTELFLKENKFPVPKFIWYVVKSQNKAAAFVIFNRTSVSDKERQRDTFCTSKCEELTWIHHLLENKSFKKAENGLVLCCEFNEFKRTVSEMPNLENINELLK